MRAGDGFAPVTTLVPDTQGTALESVANTTNTATRRWADPFGAPRGTATGAWSGDHGFLDKVTDPTTGLTAVGARFYDPGIGRFASVDPVMDRTDPQQWTGYTYSDNNPVTSSDPTGLWPNWGKAWNSAKTWVVKHQSQIAGAVAGIVVTAGCLAITAGVGSIACAAAGGAGAGAVTNLWASQVAHTQTFSWKPLVVDTVAGGVVGAATGALGKIAAPLLSKAGSAIVGAARTGLSKAAPAVRQAASAATRAASNTARAVLRSDATASETAGASDASPVWPPNNGFHGNLGPSGNPRVTVLKPGTLVDRFGLDGGRFVAPNGTSIGARSLAPGTTGTPYSGFEVTNRLVVQGGPAEPWFGQPGMGTQYRLPATVSDLLDGGYLRRVN